MRLWASIVQWNHSSQPTVQCVLAEWWMSRSSATLLYFLSLPSAFFLARRPDLGLGVLQVAVYHNHITE